MRAAAEVLDIARIGRGGAGLLGVGPGLLVRVLARLFIERHDALARLGDVRPGAEVLEVRGIRRHGTGLLGLGPRLLVRLLLRLLISRLLLRRALLRIRGLAASRYERSPRNDCNDRQFRKCDASSALGLLTQITVHRWPFPGSHAWASPLSRPTRVAGSICPETSEWSKDSRPRLYRCR